MAIQHLLQFFVLSGLFVMSIQTTQARPEGPATAGAEPGHYLSTTEDKTSSLDEDNYRELATAKART